MVDRKPRRICSVEDIWAVKSSEFSSWTLAEKAHRYYSQDSALLERLPLFGAPRAIIERFPIANLTPGIVAARNLARATNFDSAIGA